MNSAWTTSGCSSPQSAWGKYVSAWMRKNFPVSATPLKPWGLLKRPLQKFQQNSMEPPLKPYFWFLVSKEYPHLLSKGAKTLPLAAQLKQHFKTLVASSFLGIGYKHISFCEPGETITGDSSVRCKPWAAVKEQPGSPLLLLLLEQRCEVHSWKERHVLIVC